MVNDLPADIARALDRARARLPPLASSIAYYPVIGSTNDAAAALESEGAVVVADEQTAGRGRRGRVWFSPPRSGLYVSVVLTPGRGRDPQRATMLLTLAAGVGIAEGVERAVGLRADLKWPNDLYVARRKLAGILAEAPRDRVVLGYGINISAAAYPEELRDRVTSIESEIGHGADRGAVLVETLVGLSRRYGDLIDGRFDAILDAWRSRAPMASGSRVEWTDVSGARTGTTAGVDDRGALLVETGAGLERIVSGEVLWT